MTLLVISPDYASHYAPLSILADAARSKGRRVVVATGPALRDRVEGDGFEWRHQRLGAGSNTGVVDRTPAIERFLGATASGPVATLSLQARDRAEDLLWKPTSVAREIAALCDELDAAHVVVDHVSFGSTLAMSAIGRPFTSVVPGHPTQLPVGGERYGVPPAWPATMTPDPIELSGLEHLVDDVTERFTARWNSVLADIAPDRAPVENAFRVHGDRVVYNSVAELHDPHRDHLLPDRARFAGPLVRDERLPAHLEHWTDDSIPRVYIALGTFLSHRVDVIERLADAVRLTGARAAIATGAAPAGALGDLPDDWIVAPTLPQVALLRHADLAIHHGGNNSVQESLAAGTRQFVLPFSTDQFANAADLERSGRGVAAPPNTTAASELATIVERQLAMPTPAPFRRPDIDSLADFVAPELVG